MVLYKKVVFYKSKIKYWYSANSANNIIFSKTHSIFLWFYA